MKSPITGEVMTLQIEKSIMVFRREEFEYSHRSYKCEGSGEFFTTTELDELNLNQVYNQYRDRHNLPFPDEIIGLRRKYNISAIKMSKIFGFGINSYSNYEKGEVPNIANGMHINTVLNSISSFELLVDLNQELSEKEKVQVYKNIKIVRDDYHENRDDKRYIDILFQSKLPDNYTGYRKPSMEKISNMIMYFADKLCPTETKMNKLLFYSDFLNYKKTAYSISGANYMAHNYGPVPVRYGGIFDYISNKDYVYLNFEDFGNGYIGKCIYKSPNNDFNPELFSSVELESLNTVVETFRGCTATQIMNKSHDEKAWLDNEKTKGEIDYNYAFDLIHV